MFLPGCACRYTKTNIQTAEKQYNSTTMEISCHIISYHIQFQVGSEEVSIWTNVSPRGIGTGSTCCEFASPEALNVSRLREDLKVATLGPGTGVSFQHPPYGDSLRWHERCVLEDLEVPLGNHCQKLLQAICPTAISLFGDPFNATSCNLWASKYSWSLEENWLSRFRAGLWRENPFTFWKSNTASEKILKLNDLCIYMYVLVGKSSNYWWIFQRAMQHQRVQVVFQNADVGLDYGAGWDPHFLDMIDWFMKRFVWWPLRHSTKPMPIQSLRLNLDPNPP